MQAKFTSKIVILIALILACMTISQETEAQCITMTGATGTCADANGTYCKTQNYYYRLSGFSHWYIERQGITSWRIREDRSVNANVVTYYHAIQYTTSPIPLCSLWVNLGPCTGTLVTTGACQDPATVCHMTHISGSLSQSVCVGEPMTPIVFETQNVNGVSMGNLPPGISTQYNNDTIIVSGTPNSIPSNYSSAQFVAPLGNNCTYANSRNYTLDLKPKPTFPTPVDVCINSGVLTGLGGGTPIGGIYSGQGVTDDANGTTYSFDPTAAGLGVNNITYSNTNGCGETQSMEVTPQFSNISAADISICSGDSSNLVLSNVGGGQPFTYQWTPNTGMAPGDDVVASPKLSPTSTTSYSVTVTDACGTTLTTNVTVTIDANPNVVASPSSVAVCAGSSTTLNASGADSYLWSPSAQTTSSITLTPSGSGNYIVVGTDAATGCTAQDTVSLTHIATFFAQASTSPSEICVGSSANLNAVDSMGSYCASTATNQIDTKIDSVNINGTATFTSGNQTEIYTDNTSVVIPITANTPIPIYVRNATSGGFYASWVKVYIDFNQNNSFESNEEVDSYGPTTALDDIPPTTFVVPTTAYNGQTRLRIVLREGGNNSTTVPCGIYTYGETEDYTVDISGATNNPGPPVYSYSWTPGNLSGAMQTVSPTTTTTYITTQTDPNGCTAEDSVVVVVRDPSITSLTASPTSVCVNGSTDLEVLPIAKSLSYCKPVYNSGSSVGDFIESVSGFGNLLNNQTGANPAPYVSLYPTPISVNVSTPYTVNVQSGTLPGNEYALWIDYNQDSIFSINEQVGQYNSVMANTNMSFSINIPSSAYNGNTMMRVLCRFSGPAQMPSCGSMFFGETEDYVLNISGGATIPAGPYFSSISWLPSANLNASDQSLVTASNLTSTTSYTVTGTDALGCTVTSSINVVVTPNPTGNSYTDPIVVNSLPYTETNNNLSENCWTSTNTLQNALTSNDVFYKFTMPSCNDSVEISMCNTSSSIDTYIFLFDDVGNFIASNNDACALNSRIRQGGLIEGNDYYAVVESFSANQDTFVINITTYEPQVSASLVTVTSVQARIQNDDDDINYRDLNCDLIATVDDGLGGNALGSTIAIAYVDPNVSVYNGQPYARRWYQITPASDGPADVTLYFTQADFDNLNLATAPPYLPVPTMGSNTDPNIPNIRITRNDDIGFGTNNSIITPTSVNWNGTYWEVTFPTPGFSEFRLHTVVNTPLPVSYTSFEVIKKATVDLVQWSTENETSNSHFNVQRSNTDNNSFETIGTVNSKANGGMSATKLDYSLVDEDPMLGHNYYRLEQVDINGRKSYSRIIDVIWGAEGSVISVYPNPASSLINIDLSSSTASQIEIKLLDMRGRKVQSMKAKTQKGVNNFSMNLTDVASGIYLLQIVENEKVIQFTKIHKQ